MFVDAWQARLDDARAARAHITKQIKDVERQIDGILDRIVDTDNASVIAACEQRIEKLERQKNILREKAAQSVPPMGRKSDCIALALKFRSTH